VRIHNFLSDAGNRGQRKRAGGEASIPTHTVVVSPVVKRFQKGRRKRFHLCHNDNDHLIPAKSDYPKYRKRFFTIDNRIFQENASIFPNSFRTSFLIETETK
jgi:hypothetical protein